MQTTEVHFGGSLLRLNSDGSAFLPEHNTLLIADVHLGKSGVFRKAGIATPQGLHEQNLKQLARAFEAHPQATVVFLGDVFHGLQNKETQSLKTLLDAHDGHTFILVKGNHDFDLPEWQQLAIVPEWTLGKLHFLHEPPAGGPVGRVIRPACRICWGGRTLASCDPLTRNDPRALCR